MCGVSNYFSVLEYYSEKLDFLIVIFFCFYKQQQQREKKIEKNDKSIVSPSTKNSVIQERKHHLPWQEIWQVYPGFGSIFKYFILLHFFLCRSYVSYADLMSLLSLKICWEIKN